MSETREILRVGEVADDLRCSKAHVYNAINGKIEGVTKLPAICMGRRKLVRRSALEAWKLKNEQNAIRMPTPEIDFWLTHEANSCVNGFRRGSCSNAAVVGPVSEGIMATAESELSAEPAR